MKSSVLSGGSELSESIVTIDKNNFKYYARRRLHTGDTEFLSEKMSSGKMSSGKVKSEKVKSENVAKTNKMTKIGSVLGNENYQATNTSKTSMNNIPKYLQNEIMQQPNLGSVSQQIGQQMPSHMQMGQQMGQQMSSQMPPHMQMGQQIPPMPAHMQMGPPMPSHMQMGQQMPSQMGQQIDNNLNQQIIGKLPQNYNGSIPSDLINNMPMVGGNNSNFELHNIPKYLKKEIVSKTSNIKSIAPKQQINKNLIDRKLNKKIMNEVSSKYNGLVPLELINNLPMVGGYSQKKK